MNMTIVAAIIAASASIVAAVLTIWNSSRVTRLTSSFQREEKVADRKFEAERILSRFREPLLRAAYDLQSRLYNIAAQDLLEVYLVNGTSEEIDYVINNTLFLIAQFFAWNEIVRREVQFLDLGDQDRTRQLATLQDLQVHTWLTDKYGRQLRVFAGDQRAIGERLICITPKGFDCIGYAEFLDILATQPGRIPQLQSLKRDLVSISTESTPRTNRILALQHGLIDLLTFLDPAFTRYPREYRSKL
jgi:hypothetical protein